MTELIRLQSLNRAFTYYDALHPWLRAEQIAWLQSLNRAFTYYDSIRLRLASHAWSCCNPSIGLSPIMTFRAIRATGMFEMLQSLNRAFTYYDVLGNASKVQNPSGCNPSIGLSPIMTRGE